MSMTHVPRRVEAKLARLNCRRSSGRVVWCSNCKSQMKAATDGRFKCQTNAHFHNGQAVVVNGQRVERSPSRACN
eukprot:6180838-Pleurochrysis_carterae.AAC.5